MGTFFAILWDIFRKSILPANAFGLLGRISGALSMAALLVYGFDYGFAPVFLRLFEWWDWFLGAAASLTGLGALAAAILAWAGAFLDWELTLHPHWKHVFFLLSVYVFRNAFNVYQVRLPASGTFTLLWGFVAALAASAGAGAVPLTQTDLLGNFLIAAIPLAGVLVYDLGMSAWRGTFSRARQAAFLHQPTPTWWAAFSSLSRWALRRAFIGLALIAVGLPLARGLASPGLALLLLLILLLALYGLWLGAARARDVQEEGESLRAAYWRTGGAKIGAGMLGIFFWTLLFILTSAGLDLIPAPAILLDLLR